jgi:hypothetical protein
MWCTLQVLREENTKEAAVVEAALRKDQQEAAAVCNERFNAICHQLEGIVSWPCQCCCVDGLPSTRCGGCAGRDHVFKR